MDVVGHEVIKREIIIGFLVSWCKVGMVLKEMMKMTNVEMGKLKGKKYRFRQVYFHKLSVVSGCEFGPALPQAGLLYCASFVPDLSSLHASVFNV